MSASSDNDTITLEPSWKNYVLSYTISVLCIPLLGVGLIMLYFTYKKHKKYSYTFSNTRVTRRGYKYSRNVDLISIEKVEVMQSWIQQKMSVGDILLHTSASKITLRGIEQPGNLQGMLEKAISAALKQQEEKEDTQPSNVEQDPGTKNRMNYLTGLWQQGLVSDEEFEDERDRIE